MREYLTSNDTANSIRMIRLNPQKRFITILLVEGSTDALLFRNVMNSKTCEIIPTNSRNNVLNTLKILEKSGVPGILAIVDADFDMLEGKHPTSPNLLFTDTHDLETMLLKSPAFDKLLNEFGSAQKIATLTQAQGKDIRTLILECAIPIGYTLWISLRENLALRFEALDFGKFIDKETLIINKLKLIDVVKTHTYTTIDKTKKQMISQHATHHSLEQIHDATHDPWHVCRGHDLIGVLSIGLCKVLGTCKPHEVKVEMLERSLRLAFEFSHFRSTQLYLSIQHWEQANTPFLVLHIGA